MQRLLIIDNDVIIKIFVVLKESSPIQFKAVIEQLTLKYDLIWIPEEVENEFISHPELKRKRIKALKKIYETHQFIRKCPIPVANHEIDLDNGHSSEDRGETDAMLQCSKVRAVKNERYRFSQIDLFFKDKGAIKRATSKSLSVMKYSDFANQLKEIGVILP
jgi:hypothetical protein